MKQFISLAVLVLLTGCTQSKDDAIVAIFEYGKSTYEPFICLRISGHDPSQALLRRIKLHYTKVVKASECVPERFGGYLYRDQHILHVMEIKNGTWHGLRKISFEVNYISNSMFGSWGGTVVVEKLNEFWVPTSHENSWIS